ncbi:restriction endonuclease subunit S [Helicobacter pylori]|uniref:restriction endonuclease subunit S n=1 Tax=Helicobacter pylori TaxID=210 RepID=UPI0011C9FE03|nr:restriction endonuclease subunit S [Helicobacter pylori]QEF21940.1 restriction endonuclease subunit S [Helicobacter pylori]QEF26171.1 restriction endonuclease subunit S [Helicobacter pylori]
MDTLTTPLNWQRVRLGDMTTSFTKQTGFDYSDFIKPTLIKEYLPNYIPFIQNKDFLGHYINYKTDYFIPNEIAIRFPQILLNEKCLLISISGAIGNVAVFNHSQDAFIGGAIAVLKFKEKKSLDFVMHFLMSDSGQKLLLNGVKSSSHKNLTIADLRDLPIPLPPLNEQIAIANVLSDLDHYLCSLDALILKKESVKKALSFELLSQRKRLKGFNQNWQRVRLGDIAEIIGGGTPSTQITSFWNGSINWFTPTEIGITKYVYKSQRTITPLGLKKSSAKLLPIGTILLTSRASIGDCAILKVVATTNQGFQSLIPLEKINNEFLYYLMLTLKNKLLKLASGSTFLEVSPNKIKNLLIPLPPLNEQIAIANILSTLDHEIISLKNKKRQFENIKKALNHDLMSAKIRVLKK